MSTVIDEANNGSIVQQGGALILLLKNNELRCEGASVVCRNDNIEKSSVSLFRNLKSSHGEKILVISKFRKTKL